MQCILCTLKTVETCNWSSLQAIIPGCYPRGISSVPAKLFLYFVLIINVKKCISIIIIMFYEPKHCKPYRTNKKKSATFSLHVKHLQKLILASFAKINIHHIEMNNYAENNLKVEKLFFQMFILYWIYQDLKRFKLCHFQNNSKLK